MDLKDVIEKVKVFADEASNAFHAGHQETARDNLYLIEQTVVEYLRIEATPESDVTESATSETSAEKTDETPEQVPASQAQPAEAGPVLPASLIGGSKSASKPTQ